MCPIAFPVSGICSDEEFYYISTPDIINFATGFIRNIGWLGKATLTTTSFYKYIDYIDQHFDQSDVRFLKI